MGIYTFFDEALLDINEICESMMALNRDATIRFFETVRDKCRKAAQFPNMGKN